MSGTNNTKQAAWVAIGSLFSFGFAIVSSMILSRYFNKGDYGTYKQVLYVYNTLLTVFTLGLPKAFSYFLPRVEISKAKDLIKKITNIFFVLGGVFSLMLFFGSGFIASFLKNADLTTALRIFSPVPLLMLPTMGLEGILATYKRNNFMTLYTVITRLIMLLCVAVPVVFWGGSYREAIIGFTVASVFSFFIALYLKYLPVRNKGTEKCGISYKTIFQFSLPLLYASLWGIIISSSDQFFISRYFGKEVFAEFSNGAVPLPFVGMIVGACATVLSPMFSRMNYEKVDPQKEIFPLWKTVFEKSSLLVYPLVLYSLFFADLIITLLYGQQYENSVIYFRIFIIADFFRIIAYAPLIINIGKVKFYSDVHMYSAITLVILELINVYTIHSPIAIIIISVSCTLGRIFCMLSMVSKFFTVKLIELFPVRLIVKIVLPSVIILIVDYYIFMHFFEMNSITSFVFSFIFYLLIYFLWTLCEKIDYVSIIQPLFKKN